MLVRGSLVLSAAIVLAAAVPEAAPAAKRYWPVAKVMRVIDGKRVRVAGRVVRIDSDTTLCSGRGASVRRNGVRRWSLFACTFTSFTRQGVDRDLEFLVRVRGVSRVAIVDPHWVRGTR